MCVLLTLWGGVSDLKSMIARHGRHYLWKIAPLYPCGREFTLRSNKPITWAGVRRSLTCTLLCITA